MTIERTPDAFSTGASSRVQSVERAMSLLRAVAAASGPDATVPALADACGLNRSTAWRILVTLEGQGMVVRNRFEMTFSIGRGIVQLARSARIDAFVESAHPVVERLSLQTGETVALALVEESGVTYVDEVIPPSSLTESWLGGSAGPMHATSAGKTLLAFGESRAFRDKLGPPLERYTDATLTEMSELLEELKVVRRQGFAVCRGELEVDAWGVSAPVFGLDQHPLAVLSFWGPENRGGPARFDALGSLARDSARSLSRR